MGRVRGPDHRRARRLLLVVGSLVVALVASQAVLASNIENVFADFTHLDRMLTRAIDRAEKGESTVSLIDQIRHTKLEVVDGALAQPVDGVKGSTWFRTLDCVDVDLALAKRIEDFGVGNAGHANVQITNYLKAAKSCKQALEDAVHRANPTTSVQPTLKPIHAVFNPAPAGQSCHPPYCTTVYTEDANGHGLSYTWTVSIPKDPNCAKGFQPNKPNPNQATWYHADVSEGGYCNHTGQDYNASGSGHPGTVTVVVSNASWTCKATFDGTQGPQAQPTWDGPAPQACQANSKP